MSLGDASDTSFPTTQRMRQEVWALLKLFKGIPNKLPGDADSVLVAIEGNWTVPDREVSPKFTWPDLPREGPSNTVGKEVFVV